MSFCKSKRISNRSSLVSGRNSILCVAQLRHDTKGMLSRGLVDSDAPFIIGGNEFCNQYGSPSTEMNSGRKEEHQLSRSLETSDTKV